MEDKDSQESNEASIGEESKGSPINGNLNPHQTKLTGKLENEGSAAAMDTVTAHLSKQIVKSEQFFSIAEPQKDLSSDDKVTRERQLIEYKQLKSYLANNAHDSISDESIKRMKVRVWVIKGLLKYGFQQSALDNAAAQYARIGIDPHGYMSPELYRCNKVPEVLA